MKRIETINKDKKELQELFGGKVRTERIFDVEKMEKIIEDDTETIAKMERIIEVVQRLEKNGISLHVSHGTGWHRLFTEDDFVRFDISHTLTKQTMKTILVEVRSKDEDIPALQRAVWDEMPVWGKLDAILELWRTKAEKNIAFRDFLNEEIENGA